MSGPAQWVVPVRQWTKVQAIHADALEDPRRIPRQHDAVGRRIGSRGRSGVHHDAMCDAFAQITSGSADRVLGDIDVQLIASWMLNDCQLPDGGTAAEGYARRDDLAVSERDVARRIAAAQVGAVPGRPAAARALDRAA